MKFCLSLNQSETVIKIQTWFNETRIEIELYIVYVYAYKSMHTYAYAYTYTLYAHIYVHIHISSVYLHTEESFRNLIQSTRNQIIFIIFRLIWIQMTTVCLVPNQLENGKYNLILV